MTHPAIPPTGTLQGQLLLDGEQATGRLAQAIASRAKNLPSLRIYLFGDLGAGKTTFVRLLLRSLGVEGRIKSPTYALVEVYELDGMEHPACHFDLYRLETPQEWQESGLEEELLANGLRLVEWPQKAGGLLPTADLSLLFRIPEHPANEGQRDQREVTIHSGTPTGADIARSVMEPKQ